MKTNTLRSTTGLFNQLHTEQGTAELLLLFRVYVDMNDITRKAFIQQVLTDLSNLIEIHKSNGPGRNHLVKVGLFSQLITQKLGYGESFSRCMRRASMLHDVGMVTVPDFIATKSTKLSELEFESLKNHTLIGERLLAGYDDPMFDLASEIAGGHHERFDGTGYPRGLTGNEIPLGARIVAIADVFDSLITYKEYRDPEIYIVDDAFKILSENKSSQLDPVVVDVFVNCKVEIEEILHEIFLLGNSIEM